MNIAKTTYIKGRNINRHYLVSINSSVLGNIFRAESETMQNEVHKLRLTMRVSRILRVKDYVMT